MRWDAFTRAASLACAAVTLAAVAPALALDLHLASPADYQVVQRSTPGTGFVRIAGELSEPVPEKAVIEARVLDGRAETAWRSIGAVAGRKVAGTLPTASGGWWKLEVRVMRDRVEQARSSVEHVAVGEVFVVAGQSNSANHGAERQTTRTRRVATFDGTAWRLADDPQPGASGNGGSFMPPLGDAIVERLGIPVGFIPCGIGATSVREWLPEGTTFPAPPTIESRVRRTAAGVWASDGEAYALLVNRMKSVGAHGFRAVLWHQGESDANQKEASRTLPGSLYGQYLAQLIRDSRRAIGWETPWFVAQASYHGPEDRGSDDIRAAQASLWKEGVALEGPDTDSLGPEFREQDGRGVHFSGEGLRAHAVAWAEKITPWLTASFTAPRHRDGGTEWSRYEQLPECHSIGWVRSHLALSGTGSGTGVGSGRWDGVLDEAKWGTPSPQQAVDRNWAWNVSDADWRSAVERQGEGRREEVEFGLWVPDDVGSVRGIVVMSGHGSGTGLFKRQDLRAVARELRLALFVFNGNPMQRGFWPRSLLLERLKSFGEAVGHPELAHAPLFLYGHSNGTGFSAVFAAGEPERVWGWVSMRPGITFQVYQPGAAGVPGLVIFGENDDFLTRPSREENLAVVPTMRKNHDAVWNIVVEANTGHSPGEKTWPLVFSFLRHSFAARVPADADPRQGPVQLAAMAVHGGWLGKNWDAVKGGHQTLEVARFKEFAGEKSTASWLVNAAYADDWRTFQRDGEITTPASSATPAVRREEPAPIRVVVWDERQPEQKQAYDNFLGNEIAARLGMRSGIVVRSVGLDDADAGLSPDILDWAEVLVWWSHKRNRDVKPEPVKRIVEKVTSGRLLFVGLHSAHWAPPFTALMDERARADLRRQFADVPPDRLMVTEVPGMRRVPARDARVTPATDVQRKADGTVAVTLHLPGCIFPAYRNDGKSSTVKVLDRDHPLAAGLPDVFTLDRTEMYDEPYHVPEPDAVVCEETWEAGERFRSVMAWRVGAGKVVYIRPGHETFPIWKDDRMLRLLENAVRWQRTPADLKPSPVIVDPQKANGRKRLQ